MTVSDLGVRMRPPSQDNRDERDKRDNRTVLAGLFAGAAAGLVIVGTWAVVVWRLVPGLTSDRAIFVTTAEFLRHDQRLYADVWGQKDPVFYWLLALSRTPSPHGDVLLEAAYVLLAAGAAFAVARAATASRSVATVLGFAVTPMLLTGLAYYPGYTTAPGVAVTVLVLALVLHRRWTAAGVAAGVLLFLKLPLAPLGLLAIGLGWLLLIGAGERRAVAFRATAGLLVTSAVLVLVLAVRGELTGWLQTFGSNVAYADSSVGATVGPPGPPFWRLVDVAHMPVFAPFVVVFLGAAVCLLLPVARRHLRASRPDRFLAAYALGSAVVALAVLAATGIWDHHVLILVVPVVAVVVLASAIAQGHAGSLPTIVVLALLLVAWGQRTALIEERPVYDPPRAIALFHQDQVTPEAHALLSLGPSGEFARVGGNFPASAGYGIPGWRLQCRYFQQYAFTPPAVLDETYACVSTADVVLVSDGIAADEPPAYHDYLVAVEDLLARDFRCEPYPDGRLCVRHGGTR